MMAGYFVLDQDQVVSTSTRRIKRGISDRHFVNVRHGTETNVEFFEEYNAARAVERRLASGEQMKQPKFTCH